MMEMRAMKFRAVTISTIGIPPMQFEFEQSSVNAAMEFMCRSIPLMKGAPAYDFELYYVPEPGVDVAHGEDVSPRLLGRTKSVINTRFFKEPGASMVSSSSVASSTSQVQET